ncbi:MAG: HIRAN domain-containing protein [Roseiarcus sp.]
MTNHLLVIWKDPISRLRYDTGDIYRENNIYFFKYNLTQLEHAMEKGFQLFPAFPDKLVVYKSTKLFAMFSQRLPNKNRPDYEEIRKNLNIINTEDSLEMLAVTHGKSACDTIEFADPIKYKQNGECKFELSFEVAGWKYYDGPMYRQKFFNELKISNKIELEVEQSNEFDPHAIIVKSASGYKLGYVPAFYSRYIDVAVLNGKYKALVLIITHNFSDTHN